MLPTVIQNIVQFVENYTPLSYDAIISYIFTAEESILEYKPEILVVLSKSTNLLLQLAHQLMILLFYLLLMIVKASVLIFPYVNNLMETVIEFHKTQLSYTDMMIEVFVISFFILFLIFRKRLILFWKGLEHSVSTRFRKFVRILPHLIFFFCAFLFSFIGQKLLMPFVSFKVLPIFSVILPTISSLGALRKDQKEFEDGNEKIKRNSVKNQLILWIVLAAYHALATILSVIPFSSKFLNLVPLAREIPFVVFVWIQISPVFAKIVFEASLPLLHYVASKIPSSDISLQQSSGILTALKFMKVINSDTEAMLRSVLQDGVILMCAVLFSFLPYPFTYIGVVIVVFFFPVFRTYIHVEDTVDRRVKSLKRQDHLRRLLKYWICIGFLWILKIYSINIWATPIMLVSTWLQHTYFDGATKVFEYLGNLFHVLQERDRKIKMEKKFNKRKEQEKGLERISSEESFVSSSIDDNDARDNMESKPFIADDNQIESEVIEFESNKDD